MDPRLNPYAPGAGTPPPELAGREELIEKASVTLDRIRAGRSARSLILYGLRGVGKTVLLKEISQEAEGKGFSTVWIEVPESHSLASLLVPALRSALYKLNRGIALKEKMKTALQAVAGFARSFKLEYQGIEIGTEFKPEPGIADSGDLERDLADLIQAAGEAAQERDTALILFIDELQYVKVTELAALITALHRANQNKLPVALVAAGLPQLVGAAGRAKSYAERLFEFVEIGKLDDAAARDALCKPAAKEQVEYHPEAIAEILRETQGYPYFLQEWGKHSWDLAKASPIRGEDAKQATTSAIAELDASFFRVRFDRLTPSEKRYVRAMAELGPGPHRSGDIAELLGRKVTTCAPTRNALIIKGMIYSPSHGDTAFTVPLFDGFMKRSMAM